MKKQTLTQNKMEFIPPQLTKAVIVVAGTAITLAFFYGVTYGGSKILKNLENMGV